LTKGLGFLAFPEAVETAGASARRDFIKTLFI
jgi:hypothetical protein